MNIYKTNRDNQLERLKSTIEVKIADEAIKDTFLEVYDTVSLITEGVDQAHEKIDIRKDEYKKLDEKMSRIVVAVESALKTSEENHRKSLHNSRISMIANLFAVGFSLFLVFGGAEAIKQLGVLTTAIKALEILT